MSDYLNSLVGRALRLAPVVQPRPASLFEPVAAAAPVNEAAFAVSENVATQEVAARSQPAAHESFDPPVQKTERAFEHASSHTILPTQALPATLLPTQVTPATFSEGDWISTREVRDQEPLSRSRDTEFKTSTSEVPDHPTPFLIKPEVRIVSSATDPESVQPSLTAPPIAPVFSSATGPDSSLPTRNLTAQAAEPGEAPETVVVTIGRVDVRAIFPPPQAAPRATRSQPQPLSLDEYLKQRSEGRR